MALSADHYNGSPAKRAALQTTFAQRVTARHGLARGLELSAATHTTYSTNKQHHAAIARAMAEYVGLAPEDLERRGRLWSRESPEEQARRHRERYESERQAHAKTRLSLEHLTAGLTPEQRKELEDLAALRRQAIERARGFFSIATPGRDHGRGGQFGHGAARAGDPSCLGAYLGARFWS